MTNEATYPNVFRPIRVGTLDLRHRLVVPPHGGGNGNLIGTPDEYAQHVALWLAKVRGGMQWIGGGPNFVRNPLPSGFEPSGVGAHGPGFFRNPLYAERIGDFAAQVHAADGYLSVQMVLQGGMPIGPSATFSGYNDHRIAHALDCDEIAWLVREYGESAAIAVDAGIDCIEIHANHDDVVQWFLSPATNLRDDAYGGSFDNRRRLLREITESIRSHAGSRPFTFGLRLCLDEMIDGGYGVDECIRLVEAFTADGTVDYFSLDVGNNWGAPSYIPIGWHDDHEWSGLCGQVKQATHLPVVYAGRVTTPEHAESVLAAGEADLVATARATMADPEFVNKAAANVPASIRPCIGLNECIHRKLIEGITYACGVNPAFARERVSRIATTRPRDILVIGGGPGGSEFAGLAAEDGHRVRLWERSEGLGGALAIAAQLRGNRRYADWIEWQSRRLDSAGVEADVGRLATAADMTAAGADLIVVATGSTPRRPAIPGVDQPHVVTATAAILDPAALGHRIALVVEDDGPAPITLADHLAGLGHSVTMIFQTAAPAPLIGKYSIGAMLARLDLGGVRMVPLARCVEIEGATLTLAHSYSNRRWGIDGFDSVVLACGSVANDTLYQEARVVHPDVRLLGDAFAPRRMVFATRQAWQLALDLA